MVKRFAWGLTVLAMVGFASSAMAGSALGTLSGYAIPDDGRPLVLEDTNYSLIADIATGDITGVFSIQEVGVGKISPTLGGGNQIVQAGPPASVQTADAGITIEGILTGKISAADVAAIGSGGSGVVSLTDVLVEVYVKDVHEVSFTDSDKATELAAHTDGTLAGVFTLDGLDDFFKIGYALGGIAAFELGLSEDVTSPGLLPPIIPTAAGTSVSLSNQLLGLGADTTAIVDLYAAGEIAGITDSGAWADGDGNFAINAVPTPSAAAAGLLVLGITAVRRRFRRSSDIV